MTDTLSYAPPGTDQLGPAWKSAELRIVLFCWAVPLAIGLADFGLSFVAPAGDREMIAIFGLFDCLIGVGLTFTAGIAILFFIGNRWRRSARKREEIVLPVILAMLLLLLNFPIAAACIVLGSKLAI